MFLLFRCERAVWRAIEIASSVDLLGRYANLSGSRQVPLVLLGTGTMVVCMKPVGITDSDKETISLS